MALTQAQRDAIKAALNLDTLDTYASNPDSLIEQMTPEQLLEGLKCGTLSLEQLNYLFFLGFTATEKALAESKAYTDAQATILNNKFNFCNALSPRVGNLLTVDVQPDGSCKFYYGTIAEDDILNLYIDSIEGNDTNAGTRDEPLKTIKEALDRGSAGVERYIWLKELQTHIVLAEDPTTIRGGFVRFNPYGEGIDALPLNPSDYNWASNAAKVLSPTVLCPNAVALAGGVYWAGNSLVLEDNAKIESVCVNWQPCGPIAGKTASSYSGMLTGVSFASQSVVMRYSSVHFVDVESYLTQNSAVPFKISCTEVTVTGEVGVIAEATPSLFFEQVSSTSPTQTDLKPYIKDKLTATTVYSNFNTNLLP